MPYLDGSPMPGERPGESPSRTNATDDPQRPDQLPATLSFDPVVDRLDECTLESRIKRLLEWHWTLTGQTCGAVIVEWEPGTNGEPVVSGIKVETGVKFT